MTAATDQAVEPTYTSTEVARLTGATYRMVDYWTRLGYLPETASGSGSLRRFTAAELDTVRLVLALQRLGFTLQPAFEIAGRLVSEDDYRAVIADIYEITIRVRDTSSEGAKPDTTSQEASQ